MIVAAYLGRVDSRASRLRNSGDGSAIFLLECGNFEGGANRRAPSTSSVRIFSTRKPAKHKWIFLSHEIYAGNYGRRHC